MLHVDRAKDLLVAVCYDRREAIQGCGPVLGNLGVRSPRTRLCKNRVRNRLSAGGRWIPTSGTARLNRLKGITISIAGTAVLGPGQPDDNAEGVSKPGISRARAANIGLPANRRAGTTWSRVRRRPCRKRRPAHARRPRHDPPHREKIATPEIRCAKNSEPRRSIRKTAPRRTSRFGNPSAGQR